MPKPKSTISRITITRLYNLGNYEHVRYELTADVPAGCSAKMAASNLVKILRACNPKPPHSWHEITRAKELCSKPVHKMTDLDWENQNQAQRVMRDFNKWQKAKAEALKLLEKFGGKADHRDAKLDWEDAPF